MTDDRRDDRDIDREEEAHGFENSHTPAINVDVMVAQFQNQVHTIVAAVKEGDIDPLKAYASFKGIGNTLKDATPELEKEAMTEADKYGKKTFSANGVEFTLKNGGQTLDYDKDPIWKSIKKQLDDRQELLKIAFKQKGSFYDDEGISIPKVPVKTFTKDSLSVSFKKKKQL